jgi:two-component system, NtrC family, response regulator AtoC
MSEVQGYRPSDTLIGDSPAIHRVRAQLQKAALTEVPVLITGESGTGKELAARLLHDLSARRAQNFLKVSCPAIPSQLFGSELFGPEQGVFRGAEESRAGKCEQGNGGTLFLDDIGELDQSLQPQLLHALQDFRVVSLGAVAERAVNFRLVCASNRDLEFEVAKGRFRSDLFYRINVLRIQMPSLRERASDVPLLLNHFIQTYCGRFGGRPTPLSYSFMKSLESYHWPGNIRELENMVKRYIVLGGEEHLRPTIKQAHELRPSIPDVIDLTTPLRVQTKRAIQHLERSIIFGMLEAHKWNRKETARSLDISYRTLLYKIKEVGLPTFSSNKPQLKGQSFDDLHEVPEINDFR